MTSDALSAAAYAYKQQCRCSHIYVNHLVVDKICYKNRRYNKRWTDAEQRNFFIKLISKPSKNFFQEMGQKILIVFLMIIWVQIAPGMLEWIMTHRTFDRS